MMKESTFQGKASPDGGSGQGRESAFRSPEAEEVGPAGDARYSAGVQETGLPDVLCKAMKATLW